MTQAVWSPDGGTIAFVARVRDAAYEEEDDKKRKPRRFTRLQYKLDSVGWTGDRPQHLFVVPADGSAEPTQLTDGDYEDSSPAWSPDGRTLAFVSARHEDWDLEMVTDVYLVDAAGGEPRRLTQGGGSIGSVAWLPDGRLAADRYPGVYDDPRHTQDRDRRRRAAGRSRCSPGRSTATAARTPACASRSGTTASWCSSSRTTAACTSTPSRPTARASRASWSAASARSPAWTWRAAGSSSPRRTRRG